MKMFVGCFLVSTEVDFLTCICLSLSELMVGPHKPHRYTPYWAIGVLVKYLCFFSFSYVSSGSTCIKHILYQINLL